MDTLAGIYTWKLVSCMRLYWGNGSPAKVFAATPLLIMIMRIVLSFGRVNKQRPTNERALGTHQAQADVDRMTMTSCGGSLHFSCRYTAEKRKKCVCLCVWLSFRIISQLAGCLQAYYPPDAWSWSWKRRWPSMTKVDRCVIMNPTKPRDHPTSPALPLTIKFKYNEPTGV